jgi:lysozyme
MTTANLEPDLIRDEGCELVAYLDSRGNVTWGIGHKDNSVTLGTVFTQAQVDAQFQEDVTTAEEGLTAQLPWWTDLDDLRQDCLVNMTFNMGIETLATFTTFLGFMQSGDFTAAANDLSGTEWYGQVGQRAVRIQQQILTDVHQE